MAQEMTTVIDALLMLSLVASFGMQPQAWSSFDSAAVYTLANELKNVSAGCIIQ